jgi:hypothetical protein
MIKQGHAEGSLADAGPKVEEARSNVRETLRTLERLVTEARATSWSAPPSWRLSYLSWITRPSMPPATVTIWPVTWPEITGDASATT